MKPKEEKTIKISHAFELLVWLIVILLIVASISSYNIYKEENSNDYQIFLSDVDGLIVGSPVRMMGIQVGHITKIQPIKDEVYVKFVLTHPDTYIPKGTKVTVEFSGMAGSKSLEIYPPDENDYVDSKSALIEVMPPKRLREVFTLFNVMYKKFMSIIYTSSSFGEKVKGTGINVQMQHQESVSEFLDFSNNFIKDVNDKESDIKESMEKLRKYGK